MRKKFLIEQKSKNSLRNLILIMGLFLLTLLTISLVSAYARQHIAYTPTYVPYTGEPEFPLFDRSLCGAGQDFIMQVSPLGCVPSVVRSDLLEDQNVPVFCPITATQLNPLIDIESIYQISFRGEYPSDIQGISYLPARAALGRYGAQEVNNPILNNIGYAVIILKQQGNSSEIPDSVSGNLTARIKYNIQNAFGVGQANFYLPELNDDDWENTFTQYGFWDGRGYLRAEGIDENSAFISIYSDRQTYGFGSSGEKRKLSSATLRIGEKSPEMPMPGFDYCLGSMQVQLNGLESPDTRVKLTINGDIVELQDNEKFLDNKCQVRDIEKRGIVQNVKIKCDEDEGRNTFNLIISPEIKLKIGPEGSSEVNDYGLGDRLYQEGKKSLYLVYAGTKANSRNKEDLFIVAAAIPGTKDKLTEEELTSISGFIKRQESIGKMSTLATLTFGIVKGYISAGELVLRAIIDGQAFRTLDFKKPEEIFGKQVEIVGFSDPLDAELSGEFKDYYEKAIEDYDNVIDSFSSEKDPTDDTKTLGEKALFNKIELTEIANQKEITTELCNEFRDKYPNSNIPEICNEVYKLSSPESAIKDVVIDGRTKRISFDRIREPTYDEFGISLLVKDPQGKITSYDLRRNDILYLNESENHFVQLVELDDDSARLRVNLKRVGIIENVKEFVTQISDVRTLKLDFPNDFGSQYLFTLQTINLKKVAKVSVIPNVRYSDTTADFSFNIGIEKRGIELSPEKTAEKITSLNQTISKWENINDKLGKVVSGFKKACLVTGGYLTVKNFFANLGGRGIARNKVMRDPDVGWFEKCKIKVDAEEYSNIDSCLLDKADAIDAAVDAYANAMETQNKKFEELQELCKIDNGFLGEDVIDTDCLIEKVVNQNFRDELSSNLEGIEKIKVANENISVSKIIDSIKSDNVLLTQARNLQLNSRLLSDERVREFALSQIESDLGDIFVNNENEIKKKGTKDLLTKMGISGIGVDIYSKEGSIVGIYDGWETPAEGIEEKIPGGVSATSILYNNKVYILELEKVGIENYRVENVYDSNKDKLGEESTIYQNIQSSFSFKKYDKTTYENHYDNAEIRYYETAPYKGLPSIVPFDINHGWYAAIRSTLPISPILGGSGGIRAYDDSGRISSFWLCNVGQDGREEFNSGIGDDICGMINLGTGQPYNQFFGLEKGEASQLVTRAVRAIEVASRAYKPGVRRVSIEGKNIDVGLPAVNIPDIQCQDFMSPSDCNLMFNVCDPVVCPSSRCDLGGAYPVKDVVQSGLAGSVFLCLPNGIYFGGDVYVPVCLSGIHAGIDSYLSVFDSYQQCLQTSLETGQTVGICDEIYSIHMCEFFWRQSLPLVKYAIPKIIGTVLGQNVRGGGEYLGVQDAWQRASDSVDYFTQYYAANSFKAFKARTTEGVGTEICKKFVSLTTPQGGNLLDALVAPDSPSQFYGRFDEIPFTTATNPPISHYKVFYHIYAGKDLPAYYKVYLHGTGSSFFQDTAFRRIVAQGFIKAGDYETQTIDFTAPSGYQEMCISVNGQEECGFKQVTTEFGINYLTEKYVAGQASQTDITTEAACVSGTPNIYSLLSPNLQAGAEEMINPAIYNRGITRICATGDPGKATDAAAGTESARWVKVGYCGNEKMGCWLDTDSVKDTVKNTNIEGKILDDVSGNYIDALKQELGYVEDFNDLVEEIKAETSTEGKIEKINENYDKVFYNSEKGYLTLLRADAYKELALVKKPDETTVETGISEPTTLLITDEDKREEAMREVEEFGVVPESRTTSPIFEFKYGGFVIETSKKSIYYSYSGDNWYFSFTGETGEEKAERVWFPADRNIPDILTVDPRGIVGEPYEGLSEEIQEFTSNFVGKSYLEGLRLLIDRTIQNEGKGFLSNVELSTDSVKFSHKERFTFKKYAPLTFYFEFDHSSKKWKWSDSERQWYLVSEELIDTGALVLEKETPSLRPLLNQFENLIELLKEQNYLNGAKIIFDVDALNFQEGSEEEGGETCSSPNPTEEVLELLNPRDKVLKTIEELNGKLACLPQDASCGDSIEFVYTKAGVTKKCYYSDKAGKTYLVDGKTITIGVDENDEEEIIFQIPTIGRTCEISPGALGTSYREKLGYIQSGDWLDIAWPKQDGTISSHAVIFINWIGEPTRQEARVFDWIGGGFRKYGYQNIFLTENIHPVYFYKNPVSSA